MGRCFDKPREDLTFPPFVLLSTNLRNQQTVIHDFHLFLPTKTFSKFASSHLWFRTFPQSEGFMFVKESMDVVSYPDEDVAPFFR